VVLLRGFKDQVAYLEVVRDAQYNLIFNFDDFFSLNLFFSFLLKKKK